MTEKKRKAAGRQKWREWAESEEHQAVLSAWARAGMTDEEIAKQIGISRSTLAEWKKKYAPINAALATGKDFADRLIENSLYKKAIGFYAREPKTFKVKTVEYDEATGRKIKEFEELKTAEEVHYFEPDIKAIIFWLKNRKPDIWKEKVAEAMADDEETGAIVLTPTQVEQISKEVKKDE